MPYKQKPMSFGEGTDKKKNDKNNKKDDTFLKDQNESEVKSTDYLTKTPVGPVAQKSKSTYNEKEEQIVENMSNAKDNNFDGHMEIQINKNKKKQK